MRERTPCGEHATDADNVSANGQRNGVSSRHGNVRGGKRLRAELNEHRGKWVAIRDNKVIASAPSLKRLREDARVAKTDTRFAVPPAGRTSSIHF